MFRVRSIIDTVIAGVVISLCNPTAFEIGEMGQIIKHESMKGKWKM